MSSALLGQADGAPKANLYPLEAWRARATMCALCVSLSSSAAVNRSSPKT